MHIWRMKLRAGSGGDDMFPICKERGIASYTHQPIYNVDLTNLERGDVDPAVKGPARSSIWLFAWEIEGGDEIYVGDSKTHSMIARGVVAGEPGKRAYRFNAGTAITEPSNPSVAWRHEVPVEWDADFAPFSYKDPAPQHSVYFLKWVEAEERNGHQNASSKYGEEPSEALLNDLAYQRETAASKKNVMRLHATLSNQFSLWLKRNFAVEITRERHCIDLTFTCSAKRHLAELKICYGSDTRHAIREALGQIFEYNYYPSYEETHFWWLVLDCEPSKTDRKYISALRKKYGIPLTIAWRNGEEFDAFPDLPSKA